MKVATTKKGAKGTSDLSVFFFKIIKAVPITAPIKKARNKAIKIWGHPKNNPIKKANLMSPTPIQLPRETSTKKKKKAEGIIAAKSEFEKNHQSLQLLNNR